MSHPGQPRVLVASSLLVSPQKAAAANRCWELSRALARQNDVILVMPEHTQESDRNFAVLYYNRRNLALMARDSDVIIADPAVVAMFPALTDTMAPVVADLYGAQEDHSGDLDRTLGTADFFICGSEEELERWLPRLEQAGRVNPRTRKAGLHKLIDIVSIGNDGGAPDETPAVLRPLSTFCAAPRFAADRGTRNGVPMPREAGSHGLGHYIRQLGHHFRSGGTREVANRGGALIKRKMDGGRKD